MSRRERALPSRSYPWSTLDPERRNTLLLWGGIGVVVVFALALIAYGYYNDRVAPNRESVYTFAGHDIGYKDLERRTLADFRDNKLDTKELEKAVALTLAQMENEEAFRYAAKREGITIKDEDVVAKIALEIGAPGANRELITSMLRQKLQKTGLTLEDMQQIARAKVAEEKLKEKVEADIPLEGEQVYIRWIETQNQGAAVQARDGLARGETFSVMVANFSTHQASKEKGGEVGWVPKGALPPELEKVVFSTSGLTDIIETKDAFYIVEVGAKEVQPIGGEGREMITGNQISLKVQEAREAANAEPRLTQGQVNRILRLIIAEAGV